LAYIPKLDENPTTQLSLNIPNAIKDRRDFRPSPHLGTYYDFPTPLPIPETKHMDGYGFDQSQRSSWIENIELTTESNWGSTSIKFPTQKPEIVTSNDHPYPFVKEESISQKNSGATTYEFITISDNNEPERSYYGFPTPGAEFQQSHLLGHKHFGLQEKPGVLDNIPWRKVVKFLSAAIPIGLFIGALTPNVINITPVNATQSRARTDEIESRTKMQLIYSSKLIDELQRKDCRRRILCELLLSAGMSKNGQEYSENFLDMFLQQEADIQEKTNELRKMLVAVKKENCEEFHCESRKRKRHVN
ncbi:hypothetical protein AMK59_5330, partial [Oryctes borbonicus]